MKPALIKAYTFIILNSIFWGLTNIFIKVVLVDLNSKQFLFYRMAIAALFVVPFILYKYSFKEIFKSFASIRNLLVMLFSFGLTTYLAFEALNYTTVILFTIVGALRPLMADLLGAVMLREKVEKEEIIGTVVAFIGTIWMIILQSNIGAQGGNSISLTNNLIGVGLALLISFLWIVANILLKGIKKSERDLVSLNSIVLTLVMAIVVICVTDVKQFILPSLSIFTWGSLIFTATLGAFVAIILYQKALDKIEVSEANLFYYLQVAITIPGAIFILNEPFNLLMFAPLTLVVLGIILNMRKKFMLKAK
jgi:drug/metabolite transporter (DMT)-like permease